MGSLGHFGTLDSGRAATATIVYGTMRAAHLLRQPGFFYLTDYYY
jgi:hypothetical protein